MKTEDEYAPLADDKMVVCNVHVFLCRSVAMATYAIRDAICL